MQIEMGSLEFSDMAGFGDLRQVCLVSKRTSYVIPAMFVIELIGLMRNECDYATVT